MTTDVYLRIQESIMMRESLDNKKLRFTEIRKWYLDRLTCRCIRKGSRGTPYAYMGAKLSEILVSQNQGDFTVLNNCYKH